MVKVKDKESLERLIDSIQYVGRMLKRNDRAQNIPYGITKTQWFILRILGKKSCTISELAHKLEVRPSSMSQMIDRMELAGFVQRKIDASDARSKTVVLMEKGRAHLEDISLHRIELLYKPFLQLSEKEQVQIVELMEKFKLNLSTSFDRHSERGNE